MSAQAKANSPTDDTGAVYHLRIKKGDLPSAVLLPGDPGRVERIAQFWSDQQLLAEYREYRTMRGHYKGVPIASTSTGIGTAAAEIAIHELNVVGVDTCIRVGTTGSITKEFDCGDLIIPVAAVRHDGTSQCYLEPEFPAVANLEVVMALSESCQRLGFKYGFGVVYTVASFYLGQGRPLSEDGYWPSWANSHISDLQQARVTNFDTDSAGQWIVGFLHGMRMGTIVSVMANRVLDTWGDNGGEKRACEAACEAIKILREWDEKKKQAGVKYFYPSLIK